MRRQPSLDVLLFPLRLTAQPVAQAIGCAGIFISANLHFVARIQLLITLNAVMIFESIKTS